MTFDDDEIVPNYDRCYKDEPRPNRFVYTIAENQEGERSRLHVRQIRNLMQQIACCVHTHTSMYIILPPSRASMFHLSHYGQTVLDGTSSTACST